MKHLTITINLRIKDEQELIKEVQSTIEGFLDLLVATPNSVVLDHTDVYVRVNDPLETLTNVSKNEEALPLGVLGVNPDG